MKRNFNLSDLWRIKLAQLSFFLLLCCTENMPVFRESVANLSKSQVKLSRPSLGQPSSVEEASKSSRNFFFLSSPRSYCTFLASSFSVQILPVTLTVT